MKPFPHFDNLENVFGKDSVNGKQATSAIDFVDEIDQNNVALDDIDEIMNITAIPTLAVAEGLLKQWISLWKVLQNLNPRDKSMMSLLEDVKKWVEDLVE
ncbi:hypothetical protein M0R45_031149 [Rubus argutus]|uniref:Uncharacterized protein n=1 Tax=Rubus argutus TaxID=59490 RepID=A0AAW1WDF5_RUBAR